MIDMINPLTFVAGYCVEMNKTILHSLFLWSCFDNAIILVERTVHARCTSLSNIAPNLAATACKTCSSCPLSRSSLGLGCPVCLHMYMTREMVWMSSCGCEKGTRGGSTRNSKSKSRCRLAGHRRGRVYGGGTLHSFEDVDVIKDKKLK